MELGEPLSKTKRLIILELVLIFVVPMILLYFDLISKDARVIVLTACSLLMFLLVKYERWPASLLHIKEYTFTKYMFAYSVFTALGVAAIIWLSMLFGFTIQVGWWHQPHFWSLFIVVSFLQEFAYRGFMFPQLRKLFHQDTWVIVVNTLLFTLLHVIYPLPQIMLPFAAIAGVCFALMYKYYPNLLLICIAHSVLNFVAVLAGFFNI